jgi:hypothetical protein
MKFSRNLRTLLVLVTGGIFLAAAAYARPNTSVKNILKRDENPRQGTKT